MFGLVLIAGSLLGGHLDGHRLEAIRNREFKPVVHLVQAVRNRERKPVVNGLKALNQARPHWLGSVIRPRRCGGGR